MSRPLSRRRLLATIGAAGTFSVAGCSGVLNTGPDSGNTADRTESNGDGSSNGANPADPSTQTSIPDGPVGDVIDDFENSVSDRWEAVAGSMRVDSNSPAKGSQALVLEGTEQVQLTQSFFSDDESDSGVDLSAHDLSMAVRFEEPTRGKIQIHARSIDGTEIVAKRYLPKELDGWTQLDFGYTGESGSPSLDSITEIVVAVHTEGGQSITVGIDELRKIPKADTGKVMFQFDDSVADAYEKAFPELKKRGWSGGIAVMPEVTGKEGRLSLENMQEMAEAGWDMMSHTSIDKLPTRPEQEQKSAIEESKAYLTSNGFEKGARHFVAPNGRVDETTIEQISNNHLANYMFGGCPANAKRPSNMYTIPRVMGKSPDEVVDLVDLAAKHNQLVIIQYHHIGADAPTSMEGFKQVVNHVEKADVEVVSPSDFVDSI
ncbi:polysaccharide deacetylase family protein [Halocatena halophila]|uniref:polysaccharide deacetylase family protein n=1 Tax=Halocatena halophila TaxID=2814576 RepID=UPI002ED4AAF0